MHPRPRAKSKGLPSALLRQHDLLCHVVEEYRSFVAAARQEWFVIRDEYDIRADGVCGSAVSTIGASVGNRSLSRISGTVATTTVAALHFPHLIQGR
jgi:hypothetical protein